jgi:hypothetical protein
MNGRAICVEKKLLHCMHNVAPNGCNRNRERPRAPLIQNSTESEQRRQLDFICIRLKRRRESSGNKLAFALPRQGAGGEGLVVLRLIVEPGAYGEARGKSFKAPESGPIDPICQPFLC